ncbi:hypothetical protein [Vibrio algivorus]|uniref:Nuclear transport factor 2 family protein n=1 Tax=Vibrio algivorus TaxID=1667024 RepID=A0ABQ6EMU9_9VIBR|nr:hypothetical protein [Vibrio algivorus]GLT14453.1 hypothetical protein GCM10007931_14280 [Vibrio algivorus]
MNVKSKWYWFLLSMLFSVKALANTSQEVYQVLQDNIIAAKNEKITDYMNTVHSQSLLYLQTQQAMSPIFDNYELDYQLQDVQFVGEDNEYAYAKAWLETTKISGAVFANNRMQILVVFKKENGQWKIWSQANMVIQYLPQ